MNEAVNYTTDADITTPHDDSEVRIEARAMATNAVIHNLGSGYPMDSNTVSLA